jgi:hypothetical protein
MKKFLQLFVLSVLSLVAVSMKAQTYNGGVWYSLYDETERTLRTSTWWQDKEIYNYTGLFTPSTGVLTFDTKMTKNVGITDPDSYELTVNGNTVSVPEKQISYLNCTTNVAVDATSVSFVYIFKTYNSERTLSIANVKLPLAQHILLADGNAVDFANQPIGQQPQEKVVSLRSFLTAGDITITSDNPAFRVGSAENTEAMVWAVGANACASKNGAQGAVAGGGTLGDIDQYSVVIYFCPDSVKDYEGTITLTDGVSTATISVTGSGYVDQKFEQEIVWEQDLAGVNVFDTIVLNAEAKNEVTYAVSDSTIASVEGNVLVLHNAGEVEVYAYAAEDVMYLADTLAKTVVVSPLAQEIVWTLDTLVMTVGDTLVLNAVATSGLEVSYLTDVDSVVVIEAGMMVALNPGEVVVTAVQEGNNNYVAAELEYTITVVAAEDDDDDDDVTTGLEDMLDNQVKVCKIIRDGKMYIIRGNQVYDMLGTRL